MKPSASFLVRTLGGSIGMAFLVLVAGCGKSIPTRTASEPLPPEAGSNTMMVQAGIAGADLSSGGFETEFTASVHDAYGGDISDATVIVTTPDGVVHVPEQYGAPGTYRFLTAGYVPGTYYLSVSRGSDYVSGARIVAPDVHTIVYPSAYDTVSAGVGLEVDWDRSEPTQEVTVETHDFNAEMPGDAGVMTIPPSGNPPRDDQRIRVIRSNLTTITGALAGSQLQASVRASVEPVIAR